jgi:hypothetical protein
VLFGAGPLKYLRLLRVVSLKLGGHQERVGLGTTWCSSDLSPLQANSGSWSQKALGQLAVAPLSSLLADSGSWAQRGSKLD